MPENGLMRYITIAAIVIALYILLKHGKSGTTSQISPNATPAPLPGVNVCCNSPLVSVNDPIPIATDYLPNVPAAGGRSLIHPIIHAPVTSPIVARSVKPLPVMKQPVATMQNVAQPYGISQSNCTPGISAQQAHKILPPAKSVTVVFGSTGMCVPGMVSLPCNFKQGPTGVQPVIRNMVPLCTAGCYAMGHCGPNLRCLQASGLTPCDLNALNTWCV